VTYPPLHGEIIVTGTELLSGKVADVNGVYAARRLHQACLPVDSITLLGDGGPRLGETLRRAAARSRFVIVTGGLGPTDDDLTVAAAAEALGLGLFEDPGLMARIRRCLAARGLPWKPVYARLALIPERATLLDPGGAVCGFALPCGEARLFFLPGVPRQMRLLFDTFVLPALMEMAGQAEHLAERTLRFCGVPELRLQEAVAGLDLRFRGVQVGYYPNFPDTCLTLTLTGPDRGVLEDLLDDCVTALGREFAEQLAGAGTAPLEDLAGRLLRVRGLTLAVAESCSGGLICHRLTNIPGASDYFQGGVVTYSNQAKEDLLRVPAATLAAHGAVSAETALAMAAGVRQAFRASHGLAVTGIAGPTGGAPEKPVGTVFMALATPRGVAARRHLFPGGREEVKALTAQAALNWLLKELEHDTGLSGH
jgi:nicotinamide-nucleotide amidase